MFTISKVEQLRVTIRSSRLMDAGGESGVEISGHPNLWDQGWRDGQIAKRPRNVKRNTRSQVPKSANNDWKVDRCLSDTDVQSMTFRPELGAFIILKHVKTGSPGIT